MGLQTFDRHPEEVCQIEKMQHDKEGHALN